MCLLSKIRKMFNCYFVVVFFFLIICSLITIGLFVYLNTISKEGDFEPNLITTIISIIITISSSIFFIWYTYKKNANFEQKEVIRAVHSEILENIRKFKEIIEREDEQSKIEELEGIWKSRSEDGYLIWLRDKVINLNSDYKWFYIYLPKNSFIALLNRGFYLNIKGFGEMENDKNKTDKKESNPWNLINLFYYHCIKFSTDVQIIENIVTDSIVVYNKQYKTDKEKENNMDTVIKFHYISKSGGVDGNTEISDWALKIIPSDIENYNFEKIPDNSLLFLSLNQIIEKSCLDIKRLYEEHDKYILITNNISQDFDTFYKNIMKKERLCSL